MADVFLSYARANLGAAKKVAASLRSAGFSVWFDEKLPAHRAYSEVIEEQLDSADCVVVLWSREAVSSQWVRSEANRARETGRLVQARLDGARLPMPFDQIQCADLRRWSGDGRSTAWHSVEESVASLVGDEGRAATDLSSPGVGRRGLLVAGGAAAVVAVALGGLVTWRGRLESEASPEAQLLMQKGLDALQQNDAFDPTNPATAAQAVAFLTNATRLAPDFAPAWGALAMAYAVRKKGALPPERPGFDSRCRSAAQRALELDPREPMAIGALRMLEPIYRNWLAAERANRAALQSDPRLPLLLFLLAGVLGNVGRWRDAAALSRKFDRKKFLIAGADRQVIVNLWSAGDLPGADDALRLAVEHWPQHQQIWRTRLSYLMYSGRASDALQLLRDQSERPPDTPSDLVQALEATGQALAEIADSAAAVQANLAYVQDNPSSALQAAQACCAVGDHKTTMALLRGYYFGEGEWASLAPPGGDQDRHTAPLFMPPMRSLWRDRQFDDLIRRIGLEDYWRRSGTRPDYRT